MAGETYTNTVQRRAYSGERLRPADFGSAGETIARAGQGFGQDLFKVAGDLNEVQKRDAETAAQEADNMRLAQRLKYFYEGDEGFFNRQGKDAVVAAQKLPQDLRAIDEDVASKLLKNNAWARKMYDELTTRRNNDDLPKIWQHTNTQRKEHEKAVDEAAFDLAIDQASTSLDPNVIEENIATAGNLAVKQLLRTKEYDPGLIKQARQTAVGKAVAAVAQRLELKSPQEAQAFVVTHADQMDPQDAGKLLEALAPNAANEGAFTRVKDWVVLTGTPKVPGEVPAAASSEPTAPTPIPSEAALDAAQFTGPGAQEGAQRHYRGDGGLITSPKGARGVTQVMPGTGVSPGYGVKPLQNNSREEYLRFGRDYRNAMIKKYDGNIVLGLTAYNWGPDSVDAQIKKVGDPSKGQISDAAFINSIPNKEAREYAANILSRTGVSISGKPASGGALYPVEAGDEIDLPATIERIEASTEISYVDKQALIGAATKLHGLGRQAKADAEEAIKDNVSGYLNTLANPETFTDFNQLPLNVRQQLAGHPDLEQAYRAKAQNNKDSLEAKQRERNNAAKTETARQADLQMATLVYTNPEAFKRIDFTDPRQTKGMSAEDIQKWMNTQTSLQKSQQGNAKYANYDAIRTAVRRFAGKKAPDNIGLAFEQAARMEEQWISQHPNQPVPDAVREGFAREVMTQYTLVTPGIFTDSRRTVRGYEVQGKRKPGERLEVDSFEVVKAQLQQVWGYMPTDEQVNAEIQKRTTSHGLRL